MPSRPSPTQLWEYDATGLGELIAAKTVTSVEVLNAHIARIEEVNPKLNAVVRRLDDSARVAASEADERTKRRRRLGPLDGVPVSVKENIDVLGTPTTEGVKAKAEVFPQSDAPIVERMRAGGSLVFARTNLPDFGLRVHTDSGLHGLTRNPWIEDRTAAGSSGGEASAIASGMSPMGLGNDVGGSLRNPANACGIVALKPSFGRVPQAASTAPETLGPGSASMLVQGVMARSVRDLRAGLLAIMGAHPRDPLTWSAPLIGPAVVKRVLMVPEVGGGNTDPRIAEVVRTAGKVLAAAGYDVVEGELHHIDEMLSRWSALLQADLEDVRELMESVISEDGRRFLRPGGKPPSVPPTRSALIEQNIRRSEIARAYSERFVVYPLVLLPTWTQVPFCHGWDADHPREVMEMMRPVIPANYLGLPVVCVPAGMVDGSPVAVQLMADRFREDVCLEAAALVEHAGIGPHVPISVQW